jgi:hypothetical protein
VQRWSDRCAQRALGGCAPEVLLLSARALKRLRECACNADHGRGLRLQCLCGGSGYALRCRVQFALSSEGCKSSHCSHCRVIAPCPPWQPRAHKPRAHRFLDLKLLKTPPVEKAPSAVLLAFANVT